jgi:hypothetical protein
VKRRPSSPQKRSRPRALRRADAWITWPGPSEAAWLKTFAPAIEAFGSMPPAEQTRLAARLTAAVGNSIFNTGRGALADDDKKKIQCARELLADAVRTGSYAAQHDVRLQHAIAVLDDLTGRPRRGRGGARNPKQSHTVLLENLFDAYASHRLEYPDTGRVGFDQALMRFLNAVLESIRLRQIDDDELIGDEDVRGAWQRWWCTNQKRFSALK